MEYHFEFRYLDLVDQNSANAWVTSNTEKLVYLPYPEGTDKNTEFTLLRFPELNREYGMNGHPGLRTSIATTGMETIRIWRIPIRGSSFLRRSLDCLP